MTPDQSALLRRTLTVQLSDDEHALFLRACERSRLDPFARQIYFLREHGKLTIQATIDGLRLSAERTGKYTGQLGPEWCGEDGVWLDIWTSDQPPTGARVGILRSDFPEPVWGKALYDEFVVLEHGEPTRFWDRMATNQLAKCAEALGFRKAFPHEFSGLYTPEEVAQAGEASIAVAASLNSSGSRDGGLSIVPAKTSGASGLPSDSSLGRNDTELGDGVRCNAVPQPLQPFFAAGLTDRRNLQAAYSFIQIEIEHALGPEGLPAFRRIYARHMGHGLFTSRKACEAANRACMLELWNAVERKAAALLRRNG
jgi:phage recombination protein Bet